MFARKLTGVSIIIFGILTAGIVAAGFIFYQNNNANNNNSVSSGVAQEIKPMANVFTSKQVESHNTVSDCWLIIDNKVYNVTSFLDMHPGGPDMIILYCGKDATQAFDTKGGRGSHSSYAHNLLSNYYVGDLGQ
jgi:cytochrome b involved in lipid metabolism